MRGWPCAGGMSPAPTGRESGAGASGTHPPRPDLERRSETHARWDREGPGGTPSDRGRAAARLTSFCCRSSSFILMSRASARAARFAASRASAWNRPEESSLVDRPGLPPRALLRADLAPSFGMTRGAAHRGRAELRGSSRPAAVTAMTMPASPAPPECRRPCWKASRVPRHVPLPPSCSSGRGLSPPQSADGGAKAQRRQ